MMRSLRRRLFVLLVVATGVIWLTAFIWISLWSRSEIEHVLDTRLREAARMVHSLVAGGNVTAADAAAGVKTVDYEKQLSCQIWSLDGRLVARSSGAPDASLALDTEGYGERQVNGEAWRVYTIVDAEKGVRVVVGDRIGLRNRLVRDLVAGLLVPAALIMPLFAALIWFGVGRGLAPLRILAREIELRDGEDMRSVSVDNAPGEVRPLIAALNSLFGRVDASRRHERELTSFAAHELKTPLAGLRTQAQIALATEDESIRARALGQILLSVDRTSRLVRQLLALARLEAGRGAEPLAKIAVGSAIREMLTQLPMRCNAETTIDPALDGLVLAADPATLELILRNLQENACQHTPPGRVVRWVKTQDGFAIEDDGCGVADSELLLLTRRFFRGSNNSIAGTGLGLTIVAMAVGRLHGDLDLGNRPEGGFRVGIVFGKNKRA
ncbi:ATP-binding protein [Martelella alba]|nr:ATP-binding protein [Martelella alba]